MAVNTNTPQSGFIMMILLVLMVVGAAVYFGNFTENFRFNRDSAEYREELQNLNRIKQRLLDYAVFQPEIFVSDLSGSTTVVVKESSKVPAPGYFLCPDDDGDGDVDGGETNCGNPRVLGDDATGFDIGFLPTKITSRNIFFPEAKPRQYYYVVADRFVTSNPAYNNTSSRRYAPLNSTLTPAEAPDGGVVLPDDTKPWISVDGVEGYVVLIISPGVSQTFPDGFSQDRSQPGNAIPVIEHYLDRRQDETGTPLSGGNNIDGDRFFFSRSDANQTVNDLIVGITFEEWKQAVEKRIEMEKNKLCQIPSSEPHWFNDYDANNNPVGSGWRSQGVASCP